ncbi:MAG: excinuclease ABC subunit B, partial [Mycoplasmoidaceae bacterium]|nr:excinuclease ABC subunit B [Mycoplasmoidaceae bacterium]
LVGSEMCIRHRLYSEFKELFKENKVEYFVSYFDFYQPEAYIPKTDTYIEKTAKQNQEIEMLRLSTINSLATEKNVIVVASVAAIYASVAPEDFDTFRIILAKGQKINLKQFQYNLVRLQYTRNDIDLSPGTFRKKGDVFEIALGYVDNYYLRISFFGDEVEDIAKVDSLTGEVIEKLKLCVIAPANEYIMNHDRLEIAIDRIKDEMLQVEKKFKLNHKLLEAQRIHERTMRDIESMQELGYCSGIENYSRHLELREEGQTPYTLFDYFKKND